MPCDTAEPLGLLFGWKSIAAVIGRSTRWCRFWAGPMAPEGKRIPVFRLAGRPCVRREDLIRWSMTISQDGG